MSTDAATSDRISAPEQLRFAREILALESQAIARLAGQLDDGFCRAVDYVYHCGGSVLVTGMGKAGFIGQKISATLASTGTPSHWLHPAEAVHGDLGPSACRRCCPDPLPKRRDRRGGPAAAVAPGTWGPSRGHHGHGPEHPGTIGECCDRSGADRRGLFPGACAEHKHHGDVGRGRRLGLGRQPHAGFQPGRFCAAPSGRKPGPPAQPPSNSTCAPASSAASPPTASRFARCLSR